MDRRALAAVAAVVGIFLFVQLGALALVEPFETADYAAVEDPSDPTNSVVYVAAILVATVVMLVAMRYGGDWIIRVGVIGASAMLAFYVFSIVLPSVAVVGGTSLLAVFAAGLLAAALWVYPEWYVVDAAGIVVGAGAAGLFGISFGVLPALVLLVALAVYDAISVYGTEHMLTLASGVMDLRLPVVLVVPLTLSYSFLDAELPATVDGEGTEEKDRPPAADPSGTTANGGRDDRSADEAAGEMTDGKAEAPGPMERDAFFIGLGDAVIPAVLVASAGFFAPAPSLGVPGLALTLPALGAMVGTLMGLVVLMEMVMRGRAHAGLPLLNGGAIAGYLIAALASGIPLVEALGLAPYL